MNVLTMLLYVYALHVYKLTICVSPLLFSHAFLVFTLLFISVVVFRPVKD